MSFFANPLVAFATSEATKIEYNFLQKFFIWVLEQFYKLTELLNCPSWVLTIFIFTLVIRLLMQPLLGKQMRSSRRMMLLQPQLNELKKRYGNDQARLGAEQMKLYKAHNIKPTAGCLPMLIQLVIMICLFKALRTYTPADPSTFNFKLLKVDDLGMLCSEMTLWGGWGGWLLPLLCSASMFISQYMITTNKEDKTQKMMLIIMPIMYLWMVHSFQVFISIYWFFYNVVTLIIQTPLMKHWEKIDRAEFERVQKEREAEAAARKQRKAAAKARAEEKRQAAIKAGKPLPKERPEEFDFFAEEEDGTTDFAKMIYDWVEWKGWTVRRKKEKLHPWSEEEEIVETIITADGRELTPDETHAIFDRELKIAYGQQSRELTGAVLPENGLLGKLTRKKAKKDEAENSKDSE